MDVINTLKLSLKLHYENDTHHLGQGELAFQYGLHSAMKLQYIHVHLLHLPNR